MDKTIVEVYVPIIPKSYDIFIPQNSQMADVLELIKRAVYDLSDGRFIPDAKTALCMRETGSIIDINKSANESGIKNGSKLMLI